MSDCWIHLNLRTFGGKNLVRNAFYDQAFQKLAGKLAATPAVGGFTEVDNDQSAVTALAALTPRLGLKWFGAIACGQTALASTPEFVGLALGPAFKPYAAGRILFAVEGQAVKAFPEIHTDLSDWTTSMPVGSTLDFRGVVFVAGGLNGRPCAVGFIHNRYTDETIRALVMGQVPAFLDAIRELAKLGPDDPVYLGGDFNLPPSRRGTERTGIAYDYAVGLSPADAPPGVRPNGTTKFGNLYDYWYTKIAPSGPAPAGFTVPAPGVFATPMADDGSDHALVTLTVT